MTFYATMLCLITLLTTSQAFNAKYYSSKSTTYNRTKQNSLSRLIIGERSKIAIKKLNTLNKPKIVNRKNNATLYTKLTLFHRMNKMKRIYNSLSTLLDMDKMSQKPKFKINFVQKKATIMKKRIGTPNNIKNVKASVNNQIKNNSTKKGNSTENDDGDDDDQEEDENDEDEKKDKKVIVPQNTTANNDTSINISSIYTIINDTSTLDDPVSDNSTVKNTTNDTDSLNMTAADLMTTSDDKFFVPYLNQYIKQTNYCPSDCNGRGICLDYKCFCNQGFTSPDCSMGYKEYLSLGIKLKDQYTFLIIVFLISFIATFIYKLFKRSSKNNNGYIAL